MNHTFSFSNRRQTPLFAAIALVAPLAPYAQQAHAASHPSVLTHASTGQGPTASGRVITLERALDMATRNNSTMNMARPRCPTPRRRT